MRIGVVSDTHNNLRNVTRIVELFNEANVDLVVHTGDITQAKTLDVMAGLQSPLVGVFGNNDQERASLDMAAATHGFYFQDPPYEVVWASRRIVIVHDPAELDGVLTTNHDVALHGHTHLQRIEHRSSQLIFNPGECAGHSQGLYAIGIVELDSLKAKLIRF